MTKAVAIYVCVVSFAISLAFQVGHMIAGH